MAKVGSIVINSVFKTAEVTKGGKAIREEMARISASVQSGQRSFATFYKTQARKADRTFTEQSVRDEMAARIKVARQEADRANVSAEVSRRLFGGDGAVQEAAASGKRIGEELGGGVVESLKKSFGKNSQLKEIFELFKGAGAIGGLGFVAGELAEMTGRAVEFRDALNESTENAGELAERFAKSVPILGSIFTTGQNIRELLTGQNADITEYASAIDLLNKSVELRGETLKKYLDDVASSNEDLKRFIERMQRSGASLDIYNASAKRIDDIKTLNEKGRQDIDKDPTVLDLRDQLKQLQDKFSRTDSTVTTKYYTPGSVSPIESAPAPNPAFAEMSTRITEIQAQLNKRTEDISRGTGQLVKNRMTQFDYEFGQAITKAGGEQFVKAADYVSSIVDRLNKAFDPSKAIQAQRQKDASDAIQLTQDNLTPIERARENLKRLAELRGRLSEQTIAREVGRIRETLSSSPQSDLNFGREVSGSFKFDDRPLDDETADKQLDELSKTSENTKELVDIYKKLQPVGVYAIGR